MHQIRGALDEAVARAEALAELEESAVPDAPVGEVGAEIVKRLRAASAARKDDLHSGGGGRRAGLARRLQRSVLVDVNEAHVAYRFPRAREKHIQDRERAGQLAAMELPAHVLGDEETVIQHIIERRSEVPKRVGK